MEIVGYFASALIGVSLGLIGGGGNLRQNVGLQGIEFAHCVVREEGMREEGMAGSSIRSVSSGFAPAAVNIA